MRSNTAAEDAMPMVEETVGMGAAETTVTADGATVVELSAFEDIDDQHLARLGYKPVFKREFSMLATFSFAFSISGLFATVATTFIYPLDAGGPACVVWAWFIGGFGCMCIAASVAELCSAYPSSGGLYFTCSALVPRRYVPVVSWVCGWLNLLGQFAGVASTDFGAAQMLLAAVSMGSDFTYSPTNNQTVGVFAAIVILHCAINTLSTRWLDRITRYYAIFHISVVFAAIVSLLVLCTDKHTTSFVFTDVAPSSGWTPRGFSFLFGFLSVAWCMTDYDATAHIAEEIEKAETRAPWAIFNALLLTYLLGWVFNIVLVFVMGDAADILASPVGQPVAQIFYNVLGKGGGITLTVFAFLILNFTGITAIQANARTVFALGRDEMLPFSRAWIMVNKRTGTPIWGVWLVGICCILLGFIAFGSYLAIAAIFNVCSIALDWSYCIPIFAKLVWGDQLGYKPGPWNMGRFSKAVNAYAIAWTLLVSVIFILPTYRPVTPQNMNYAIVVLAGIGLFALVWWFAGANKYYVGPRSNIVVTEKIIKTDSKERVITYKKETVTS